VTECASLMDSWVVSSMTPTLTSRTPLAAQKFQVLQEKACALLIGLNGGEGGDQCRNRLRRWRTSAEDSWGIPGVCPRYLRIAITTGFSTQYF
jgi:hypothetical protein